MGGTAAARLLDLLSVRRAQSGLGLKPAPRLHEHLGCIGRQTTPGWAEQVTCRRAIPCYEHRQPPAAVNVALFRAATIRNIPDRHYRLRGDVVLRLRLCAEPNPAHHACTPLRTTIAAPWYHLKRFSDCCGAVPSPAVPGTSSRSRDFADLYHNAFRHIVRVPYLRRHFRSFWNIRGDFFSLPYLGAFRLRPQPL